jgi:hypothetical protein
MASLISCTTLFSHKKLWTNRIRPQIPVGESEFARRRRGDQAQMPGTTAGASDGAKRNLKSRRVPQSPHGFRRRVLISSSSLLTMACTSDWVGGSMMEIARGETPLLFALVVWRVF